MSYFDEHDCEPLAEGQSPQHDLLHLVRLLFDGNDELQELLNLNKKPPAARHFIENLPKVNDFNPNDKCCVCLKEFVLNETVKMPCKHLFHENCIVPWLKLNNACPLCREEVPTDDMEYEKNKKERRQRQHQLDQLHNSMFA